MRGKTSFEHEFGRMCNKGYTSAITGRLVLVDYRTVKQSDPILAPFRLQVLG